MKRERDDTVNKYGSWHLMRDGIRDLLRSTPWPTPLLALSSSLPSHLFLCFDLLSRTLLDFLTPFVFLNMCLDTIGICKVIS